MRSLPKPRPFAAVKPALALAAWAAAASPAIADDWQYCLAPSYAEHKVYMSEAFRTPSAPGDAAGAFARTLDDRGLHHSVIQCPRGDDQSSIMAMMNYAVVFNRENGNAVIYVPMRGTR